VGIVLGVGTTIGFGKISVGKIIVTTVPEDLARFADDLGRRVTKLRLERGSVQQNNLEWNPAEFERISIMGFRGEAALYRGFGGRDAGAEWDNRVKLRGTHKSWDIKFRGNYYDAKAGDKPDHPLIVIHDQIVEHHRYVLVDIQHWPEVAFIAWCTGAAVLKSRISKGKGKKRPAHFIDREDPLLRSVLELPFSPATTKIIEIGYILEHEGSYVERIEATEWQTVSSYFVFTKDMAKAKLFSYNDLYWKQATSPPGILFMIGFSRGRAIRIARTFPLDVVN